MRLTNHARRRIRQRNISPDALAAALTGRVYRFGPTVVYYDRATRCCVVADEQCTVVRTAFCLTRAQAKRYFCKAERIG